MFRLFSIFFAVIFAFSSVSLADTVGATRVAVVDVQMLLSDSDVSKSIVKQVMEKSKKLNVEFSELEQKLAAKKQKLLEKKKKLSKEDFEKQVKDFEKEIYEARKLKQQKREEIDNALNKARENIHKKITSIVGKLSKEKKFDIVITSNDVIIYEKTADLTDEVMKILNKELGNIDLELSDK